MDLKKEELVPVIIEALRNPKDMVMPKLNDEAYAQWGDQIASAVMVKIAVVATTPPVSVTGVTWANYPELCGFFRWITKQAKLSNAFGYICKNLVMDMAFPFRGTYDDALEYISKKASPDAVAGFEALHALYFKSLKPGKTTKKKPVKKPVKKKVVKKKRR